MQYKFLSRNAIKYIAMASMVIDHTAICFIANNTMLYFIMRDILGRIAWPLFAMLLVEGLFRTYHPWRHVLTLLAFAVITEPVYDLVMFGNVIDSTRQNVLWNYVLVAVFICIFRADKIYPVLRGILAIAFGVLSAFAVSYLNFTGGVISICGIFIAALIYSLNSSAIFATIVTSFAWTIRNTNLYALIPIGFSFFYNPDKLCKHNAFLKYFGYAFYPGHLLILYLLKLILV